MGRARLVDAVDGYPYIRLAEAAGPDGSARRVESGTVDLAVVAPGPGSELGATLERGGEPPRQRSSCERG
jgi:hypothetical protein